MMQKNIYTFILFFVITGVFGQGYNPPLKFQGYTPLWEHVSIDREAISPTYDGMSGLNHPFTVLNDSSLYIIYLDGIGGDWIFLEKLNSNNGDLIWNSYIDRKNSDTFERASCGFINDDKNLELLAFRSHKNSSNIFYPYNSFSRIIYDKDDGSLLYHKYPDVYDTLSPALTFSYFIFANQSYLYRLKNQYYLYLSSERQMNPNDTLDVLYDTSDIYSYILDSLGHKKSEKFLKIQKPFPINYMYSIHLKADSTYWTICSNRNSYDEKSDTFSQKLYLIVFDKDLNILVDKELQGLDYDKNKLYYFYNNHDEEYFILESYEDTASVMLFYDYKGKLVNKFVPLSDDGNRIYRMKVSKLEDGSYFVVGTTLNLEEANINNYLYFFKVYMDGCYKRLKKLKIRPVNNFFDTEFVNQLDNGNIVVGGKHQYYKYSSSGKRLSGTYGDGDIHVTICFSAEDLGIKTSIKDITTEKKLIISPNPAKSSLTLDFDDVFSGNIKIIDALGRVVVKKVIQNATMQDIDISALSAGIYFVKAIDMLGHKEYKTARFVKE